MANSHEMYAAVAYWINNSEYWPFEAFDHGGLCEFPARLQRGTSSPNLIGSSIILLME